MNRKNAKEDKMKMLKKNPIQPSPHTPITDRLGSTENKIRKEIAIMKKCRHAHIVRLLEVIDDRMKSKIYMSECISPCLPHDTQFCAWVSLISFRHALYPLQPFSFSMPAGCMLIRFFVFSHGISWWRRNQVAKYK